jgi:hypothetical protein
MCSEMDVHRPDCKSSAPKYGLQLVCECGSLALHDPDSLSAMEHQISLPVQMAIS